MVSWGEPGDDGGMSPTSHLLRDLLGTLAVIALTLATWWLWLGRDHTYYTDPATGFQAGPYTAPQVAGCILTLALIGALGGWFLRWWLTALALTITFTSAWTADAAANDDSGLFVVGAGLVLIGLTIGSALVCGGAALVRLARRTGRAQPLAAR
jgi:hypothetical protein